MKFRKPKTLPKTAIERVNKYRKKKIKSDNSEHYLGPMNVECCHCGVLHFAKEKVANKIHPLSFGDCCSHGAVPRASFHDFPLQLKHLFERKHEFSSQFLNYIRSYNSSFSFPSFNTNLVNFHGQRAGPYSFKIRGQIYNQINTALHSQSGKAAKYGQLFILDANEANQERIQAMPNLNEELLLIIDKIMRMHNVFAKSYTMMKKQIEKLERKARKGGYIMPEVQMSFLPRRGFDARRYNAQQCNEVAIIFTTTADGDIPDTFITIHNSSTEKLETIIPMDPKAEPFVYPLFYPSGSEGWHKDMCRLNSTRRITRTDYIKNLISIRDSFNPILCGGRLFQQ